MQKISTRVFMCASVVFGIVGIIVVLTGGPNKADTLATMILARTLFASAFVILTSFALSIASKYLGK
jgi:hypothetical protein